jgi:hypothetical protein
MDHSRDSLRVRWAQTLDVCAGDDAVSAPKPWPPDTEPQVTATESRFKGVKMRQGVVHATPGLAPEVIERNVEWRTSRFRYCYESGLWKQPLASVEVTVRIVIDRSGATASSRLESSRGPAEVVSCIEMAFAALSFPPPKSATVDVSYGVVFTAPPDAPPPAAPAVGPWASGAIRWAQVLSGPAPMRVYDVSADGREGFVVAGVLTGPATFGTVQLHSPRARAVFVLRLDAHGQATAGATLDDFPAPVGDEGVLLAVAPDGDAIVAAPVATGRFVDLKPEPGTTAFLARVGADGTLRWSRDTAVQTVTGLAVGSDGGALVGNFNQLGNMGTSMLVRWSADGSMRWQKVLGDLLHGDPRWPDMHWRATLRGVAIDREGAIVVIGTAGYGSAEHIDLGLGPVNANGFVAKLASDGQPLWSRGTARGEPMAVAAFGDRVVVGTNAACGHAEEDSLVMAMDSRDGAARWAWRLPEHWPVSRVAIGPQGHVTFVAWRGERDALLGSVDPAGAPSWTRRLRVPEAAAWQGQEQERPPTFAETEAGPVLFTYGVETMKDLPEEPSWLRSFSTIRVVALAQ